MSKAFTDFHEDPNSPVPMDPYNPSYYYLKNRKNPDGTYYNFFFHDWAYGIDGEQT